MKKGFSFLLLLFIILNGCNSKTTDKTASAHHDSIQKYIALAGNDTLEFNQRIKYNDKALSLVNLADNDSLTRENLNKIVYNYFMTKDSLKFKKYSRLYYKKALQQKDTLGLARYYRYKGGYFRATKVYDSAFYYCLKSEKLYLRTNDKKGLAIVYLSKSTIQNELNDFLGAELSAKKAYSYFKVSKFHYDYYTSVAILGNVYQDLKEYDKAIIMLNEAILIVRKNNIPDKKNNYLIGACLNNIGNVYREQENYNKAIKYFKLALKQKNIIENDPSLYANLLNNLGYCYLKTNQNNNLPSFFFQSKKIFEILKIKDECAISDIYLSEFYIKKKDTIKAIQHAESAVKLSKEANAPYYYLTAISNAGSINPEKASKYIKEYHHINDSLLFAERNARNQYFKIQLETDEIAQQKDTALKQKSIVFAVALILLIITILIFIIARQQINQKELQLYQNQQKNNEEIYQLMLTQETIKEKAREAEKKRIGLELHDGVMNKLISTRLNLSVLSVNQNEKTIEKCLDHIKDIQNIENEIRNVAHNLNHEAFSDVNGFNNMLTDFVEDQNKISKTSFVIKVDQTVDWDFVSNNKKMNLYRIIQEASLNINKHANATKATIDIMTDGTNICLSIADDGIGFKSSSSKNGIGLKNIKHRVKELNGKFNLNSKRNAFTTINITIPLKDPR